MRFRGPNNVGRAVQTDPTLLCHASATTKQKKYWELLAQKFDRFQTLSNNSQQFPTAVQTDATWNIQQFGATVHPDDQTQSFEFRSCWPILLSPFARGFNEQIGIIIQLISNNSSLLKPGYVALDAPTSTLRSISGKTCWTGSTRISTNISWRRKVSAINTCITRLTIHLAGINVAITESSCVSSLTCAAHIHEFAVSVDFVTFFWGHALTTVVAGAHVNRGTPGCTRSFIVSGNEWKIKLKQWKNVIIFSSIN